MKDFSVCVQAGANVGVFPAELARYFDVVYAFEPDVKNYELLLLNTKMDNIVLRNAALGSKCGFVETEPVTDKHKNNTGAVRIKEGGATPVLKIDDLALKSCGLVFLDIEGFELFALRGARDTLQEYKPVVVVEENGRCRDFGVEDMESVVYLQEIGYTVIGKNKKDIILGH